MYEELSAQILVVEDNRDTQILLKYLLRSNFRLVLVSRVEEALTSAVGERFDLLLVDINLGEERTGVDLLHLLRAIPDYANTPILALTAYAMPGDQERFIQTGFDGYISKPFTREELLESIHRALDPNVEG
jgi:CheY-like chemotaxis protein